MQAEYISWPTLAARYRFWKCGRLADRLTGGNLKRSKYMLRYHYILQGRILAFTCNRGIHPPSFRCISMHFTLTHLLTSIPPPLRISSSERPVAQTRRVIS